MSNTGLAEPSRSVEPPQRRRYQLGDGLAGLMGFEAATLAAAAFLHLHGDIEGRSTSFDPDMAGIAEAVIGVVLVVGAVAAWGVPDRGRRVAVGAVGFAIVGFVVGLSFTARGGDLVDVLYHAVMLPILVLTLVLLLRVPHVESSLSRQRNILLTTYRRDGTPVATPVNVAVANGHTYFRTWTTSGKARRIAPQPKVAVAACTSRGTPTGPTITATAHPLEGDHARRAAHAITHKYPLLQGIFVPLEHRMTRRHPIHYELTFDHDELDIPLASPPPDAMM
jgi:uncharacterized protein